MANEEAFLELERALIKALSPGMAKRVRSIMRKVGPVIRNGTDAEVELALHGISLDGIVDAAGKRVQLIAEATVLFGAAPLHTPKDVIAIEVMPPYIEKALKQLRQIIEDAGADMLRDVLRGMANKIRLPDHTSKADTIKADTVTKADPTQSQMTATALSRADQQLRMGASLTLSRVASLSLCLEAEAMGRTEYVVNEILDKRTCPICRRMHGKRFQIADAKRVIVQSLETEDPSMLYPWPKQDAESRAGFQHLSDTELTEHGWNVPPYHPNCRGLLTVSRRSGVLPNQSALRNALRDSLHPEDMSMEDILDQSLTASAITPAKKSAIADLWNLTVVDRDGKAYKKSVATYSKGENIRPPVPRATAKQRKELLRGKSAAQMLESLSDETLTENTVALKDIRTLGTTLADRRTVLRTLLDVGEETLTIPVMGLVNGAYVLISGAEAVTSALARGITSITAHIFGSK